MAITFKHALAKDFLREQAKIASENNSDLFWLEEIERLSSLCEAGCPKTHIAFLGAALLAKALNQKVDLYAIKPTQRPDNPNAFSARSLAHSVLVPLSAELGIHLGVTGREPLNNQPYFRMKWLNDDTPIRADGRQAFDLVLGLIERLSAHTRDEALSALRSFIVVRMRYQPRYGTLDGDIEISPSKLIECIQALSKNFSEGGKVAQAIAAGVLDVIEGMDFIESGRINDPDRRFPGDRGGLRPDLLLRGRAVQPVPRRAHEGRTIPFHPAGYRSIHGHGQARPLLGRLRPLFPALRGGLRRGGGHASRQRVFRQCPETGPGDRARIRGADDPGRQSNWRSGPVRAREAR